MNVTCNKCKSVSNIPDSIIPSGGINIECPNCSNPIYVTLKKNQSSLNLNYDSIGSESLDSLSEPENNSSLDSDAESHLSLDIDIEGDSDEIDSIKQPEISPSMIMNFDNPAQNQQKSKSQEIKKQDLFPMDEIPKNNEIKSVKVDLPKKEIKEINKSQANNQNTQQPNQQNNQNQNMQPTKKQTNSLESYLNLQTASKIKEKPKLLPILIIAGSILFFAAGGAVFYTLSKPKQEISSIESLGLKDIFADLGNDNYYNYHFALKTVNEKLLTKPNELVLKAAYVYVASKYFLSVDSVIDIFAPNFRTFKSEIEIHSKDSFIDKTLVFAELATLKGKGIPTTTSQKILELKNDEYDSLYLKSYLFFTQNKTENIIKSIQTSTIDKKYLTPIKMLLLKNDFKDGKNISEMYNEIKLNNPTHVNSKFIQIKYLMSFSMYDKVEEVLTEIDSLKKYMGDYELSVFYLTKADLYKRKADLKEAFKYVKMTEDLKVSNIDIFKQILTFYYDNYYTTTALDLLKNNFKKYEYDFEINELYVKLLIRNEDYGQAGQICSDLREKNPKKPEVFYLSAFLNSGLKNSVKSIEYLDTALSLNPKYEIAYVLLAKEYINIGRKQDALNNLKEGVKNLNSKILKEGLADIYFDLHQYQEAKEIYAELIAENTSKININAEYKIAIIDYSEKKDLNKVVDKLNALYKIEPNFENLRNTLAQYQITFKNYERVIELMKEELKIKEKSSVANLNIGIAYYFLGEYVMALEHLSKATAYDPKNPEIHFYIGKSFQKQEKYSRAVDSFLVANSYDNKNISYLFEIARVYNSLNKFTESIEYYDKIAQIETSYDLYYERGIIYDKIGNTQKTIEDLNAAYTLNSSDIKLILLLGNALFKSGKNDQALSKFQKVISIDKNQAEAHFSIGKIIESQGKPEKAINYYENAIRLDSKVGVYYYQLGFLYKGLGKYQKALKIFKAYLKNIPDTPDKNEIQNEIYDLESMK